MWRAIIKTSNDQVFDKYMQVNNKKILSGINDTVAHQALNVDKPITINWY